MPFYATPPTNYGKVIAYNVESAVGKYRIVKYGATARGAALATAASNKLAGVSTEVDTASTDPTLDVVIDGIAPVYYGGTVAYGDPLTTNNAGAAVVATSANSIIGYAEVDGVSGDIGSVRIAIHNPAPAP